MTRHGGILPRTRAAGDLVVEELPDELLVYDTVNHRAHCLNRAAAEVFAACRDGRGRADVQAALASAGQASTDAAIDLALEQLGDAGLLAPAAVSSARVPGVSRRDALHRVGFIAGVALALPLVQSIVAPSIAQAASPCLGLGVPCSSSADCCSGLCQGSCTPNN